MASYTMFAKTGLPSKLKERWSQHWRKVLLVVVGVPLLVGIIIILVALLRAAIISHDGVEVPSALSLDRVELINKTAVNKRTERLSWALQINTTSISSGEQEFRGLLQMHAFLVQSFPMIHTSPFIRREVVSNYSLLYTIDGSVEGKLPYLLASHLDVVPANPDTWEVPPFSGKIVNNTYVYGRGAMDDKMGVMAIMEALEYVLQKGERPKRSFYLAFGHDEEVGGRNGAAKIAAVLTERGVTTLDFVLDEGFPVSIGMLTQIDRHVAMIGIAEKGNANIQLTVKGNPGHSSFPPKESSIGILGSALARLEAHPQPAELEGTHADTFKYMVPFMDFSTKFLYNNFWLFTKRILSDLSEDSFTNAVIRTTTAVTIFNAGVKSNVVPPVATAIVNHRVHPSQTVAEAVEYDKEVIEDSRVEVEVLSSTEPSPISPYEDKDAVQFQLVATSIKQVFTEAVVVPGVLIANTDTRWYIKHSKNVFRFLPTVVNPVDSLRYHGNNERISIEHYHQAVNFYYRLIRNADMMINTVPSNTNTNTRSNATTTRPTTKKTRS